MKRSAFLLTLVLTTYPLIVLACEPCGTELDLTQTTQQADLVILAQKVEDGPLVEFIMHNTAPAWIKVKVIEPIKGDNQAESIKIITRECGYGITGIENNKTYVIFLKKNEELSKDETIYDAVNDGCAVKSYLVDNGQVNFLDVNLTKQPYIEFKDELKAFLANSSHSPSISPK